MAAIGSYYEVLALNYLLNTTAVTRPTTWGMNLSLGAPNATSASEIATGSGITRQTVGFGTAIFGGGIGTASNSSAVTFGPINTAGTISGAQLWDSTASSGAGNMLFYGTLASARTMASGDSISFAIGALSCTLQ
jgi:hypothetical protein